MEIDQKIQEAMMKEADWSNEVDAEDFWVVAGEDVVTPEWVRQL